MKKVILLCASPRKKGNTALVLEECSKVIKDAGVETETVSLAGMRIESCIACRKCAKTGECSREDGLNEIISKVKESRGFVVGTPVYFGMARGDLTSALQRIGMVSWSNGGWLSRKVGGPIAVARRGGHTATLQELLMFYLINDMVIPGSNSWNMLFGWQPGEVMDDEEGLETARRFAENVAWLIDLIERDNP
jgi:multimeric flavodoxin WrbA